MPERQAPESADESPPRLQALITGGLIDAVVRQLMSAKAAEVYVVRRGDEAL